MIVDEIRCGAAPVISPTAPAAAAAREMELRAATALVVVDAQQVVGIITDGDLARRVRDTASDPDEVLVADIMSAPAIATRRSEQAPKCAARMRILRIHQMPVLDDDGGLAGMVTLADVDTAT